MIVGSQRVVNMAGRAIGGGWFEYDDESTPKPYEVGNYVIMSTFDFASSNESSTSQSLDGINNFNLIWFNNCFILIQ